MLVRPASETIVPPDFLLVPGGAADPARIGAKQILALAFQGERRLAESELQALQRRYPQARGNLAGTEGPYTKIIAKVIENLPNAPVGEGPWATFAGSSSRNGVCERCPSDRWWADGPTWRVSLFSEKNVLPRPGVNRPIRYHPVIGEDKVLITDDRTVTAYHLLTGKELFRFDPFAAGPGPHAERVADAFTLTMSDGCIFARLKKSQGMQEKSFLMCLEMIAEEGKPDKVHVRERWRIPAKEDSQFEGAPLVHDGLVTIAYSRSIDKRIKTSLACFDAATGRSRWRQEICDVPEIDKARRRNHLLTQAGSFVVYGSDSGAVIAVDQHSGKRIWGLRYLSRGLETKDGTPSPRELCPPLFSGGRLFIAPADSDRIFCLDAQTGQTLWERGGIEVVHLFGVANGRLIFTTPQGLRALQADTGLDQGGWLQPAVGRLVPFGRGLLAGDWVFWPTRDPKFPVRAVTQERGEQELPERDGMPAMIMDPNRLRLLRPGNMALGNGCLVVAGPDELVGYVSPARLLQKRQVQAGFPAASPKDWYLLAQSQAEAGFPDLALKNFNRVASFPHAFSLEGKPIQTLALEYKHELLLDLARGLGKKSRWQEASEHLQQAAGGEFPVPLRLSALLRLPDVWLQARQPQRAVAAWQAVLTDASLREGFFFPRSGSPQLAAALAKTRIQELIKKYGITAYADIDKQAGAAFAKGRGSMPALEQLVRQYPNSSVIPVALSELAGLEEKAGRFGAAAQTYRLILQNQKAEAAPALIGLARAYEKEHCYRAAKAVWMLLAQQHGDKMHQGRPLRDLVADQLRKPEYHQPPKKLGLWPGTLVQIWSDPGGNLLAPVRNALASPNPDAVFIANGNRLRCLDPTSGKERWARKLPFLPTWTGLHADMVLAGGSMGVMALRLEDGQPIWTFNPFPNGPIFGHFHLTTSHLYFLAGSFRLFALELYSGRVAWSREGPGSMFTENRFAPHFFAGGDWVLAQSGTGRRLFLDAATGRLLHDHPSTGPWAQDPLPLDDQRLCLVENGRVILLHAPSGKEFWTYAPSWTTSWSGEPLQLLAKDNVLLAVIPRNYGCELERLDPGTGKALWDQPRLLGRDPVAARTISIDEGCCYYVADHVLTCRSLADGKRIWHKQLTVPSRRWQTLRGSNCLLAYPADDCGLPWLWLPLGNMVLALPSSQLYESRLRPLAVCCHDPKDGRLLQRLDFSVPDSELNVGLFPDRLVVSGGRKVWSFADKLD
jgi:outer membrane protein assembly factor BamB/tetratricopeptide (TPR) repeat protein